ncbi:MAG: hypothetical protein M3542_03370 [Acidobacteriota bacterium]|nr:hypothetical protein [Acidobacteriota bacterium]
MPRDRPRLWESFKRALGTSPRENASDPAAGQRSTDLPPFLSPDETPDVPRSAGSAPVRAQAEPTERVVERIDAIVADAPDEAPTPAPEAGAPQSARLARGLASFSRDNADREKKFRHILSDGDKGATKKG